MNINSNYMLGKEYDIKNDAKSTVWKYIFMRTIIMLE